MAKLGQGNRKILLLVIAGLGVTAAAVSFGVPGAEQQGCGGPAEEANQNLVVLDTQVSARATAVKQLANPCSVLGGCGGPVDLGASNPDLAPTCQGGPILPPSACINSTGYPQCWYFRRDHIPAMTSSSVYLKWEAATNATSYVLYRSPIQANPTWTQVPAQDVTFTGTTSATYNSTDLNAGLMMYVEARRATCASIQSNVITIYAQKRSWTADMKPLMEHRATGFTGNTVPFGAQCATCHRVTTINAPQNANCYARNPAAPNTCLNDGFTNAGLDLTQCGYNSSPAARLGIWKGATNTIPTTGGAVRWAGKRVFSLGHNETTTVANYGITGFPSNNNTANPATLPSNFLTSSPAASFFFVCNTSSTNQDCQSSGGSPGYDGNRIIAKVHDLVHRSPPSPTPAGDQFAASYWPDLTGQMPLRYNANGSVDTTNQGETNSEFPFTLAEYNVLKSWIAGGASCN